MRFLQRLNATHFYACGTHAFQPLCAAIVSMAAPPLTAGPGPLGSGPWPQTGLTLGFSPCLPSRPLTSGAMFPQDAEAFTLPASFEEGKEKCPYDPARGFTGLVIGERALPAPPVPPACGLWDMDLLARTHHPRRLCALWYVVCLTLGLSLLQMEASTQPRGMNSGVSLTSAGAGTRTP